MNNITLEVLKNIIETKTYNELYDIPWKILSKKGCSKTCGKGINILILNTPCNGFGDIMFASKLALILRNMFGCRVDIATTFPDKLEMLGENKSNIISLKTKNNHKDCRRFRYLDNYGIKLKYDILFVAPVNQDHHIDHNDIKYLIPYSNRFNTFFFSEYNDDLYKKFDFHTGVGEGYSGLLITHPKIDVIHREHPYALAYIAGDPGYTHIPLWRNCIMGFVELVSKKHKHEKIFEVVGPYNPLNYITHIGKTKLNNKLGSYFGTIQFIQKGKDDIIIKISNKRNLLILNSSVFPVSNKIMLSLMKYSVKDILLTGDQSITDCLSCCPDKNIWYQSVPWKYYFTKELANSMPNKYLGNKFMSCGSTKTTLFRSNYKKFISNNNFSDNARPKLIGIVLAAKESKNKNSWVSKFENQVMDNTSILQFKKSVNLL